MIIISHTKNKVFIDNYKQGDNDIYFHWDSLTAHLHFILYIALKKIQKAESVQSLHLVGLTPITTSMSKMQRYTSVKVTLLINVNI
ncbi:hypothetical protein [Lactobacillus acetotolerans]|uniref:hypothetical protein n=1 Tax=Lactobacillus acetotolerans TaxID=1600 RepID=UPI002FD8D634